MITLEQIMREYNKNVVGWRLWYHHREVDKEEIYSKVDEYFETC